jgi:hypothetical protein
VKPKTFILGLDVPPLQGGDSFWKTFSWAFSPSFNMTGFQPGHSGQNQGLQARDVIAWAEGPRKPFPQSTQAL